MTPQTVTPGRTAAGRWHTGLTTVPAIAGFAYLASWVAGLSVAPSSTDVSAAPAQVVAGLAGHQGATAAQFLLTEGAASIALAVVAAAAARAGARAGAGRSARVAFGTAVAAAAIALLQCVLGLRLAIAVGSAGQVGTAAALNDAISRLDGVKMFLLAAMAAAATVMARQTGLLPRWLQWTGLALVVAIVASGIGYALLNNTFALAAWVSLPLLLIWVAGTGLTVGRRER